MSSILTHTFGTYTVFRTIHSIYENTNEVAPCIVAFTPCDDMMLSTSTMEYELQDVFDTFDYLSLSKFTSLIQVCSEGFFLDSTYAVISCLYTLCNGLSVPLVTESGFKLEKFTIS